MRESASVRRNQHTDAALGQGVLYISKCNTDVCSYTGQAPERGSICREMLEQVMNDVMLG